MVLGLCGPTTRSPAAIAALLTATLLDMRRTSPPPAASVSPASRLHGAASTKPALPTSPPHLPCQVGPTTELRKWFGHNPDKWEDFQRRYAKELDANREVS